MNIAAILIGGWIVFVVGVLVGLDLARAPLCTCGDLRCGGACLAPTDIDWDNAA